MPNADSPTTPSFILGTTLAALLVTFDPGGWAAFGPVKWMLVSVGAFGFYVVAPRVTTHSKATWWWAGFLVWGAIVSLFALDPLSTYVGTPDRHFGLLAWLVMAGFFVAGLSVVGHERVVLRSLAVAGIGIGLYTAFELAGWAPVELASTTSRAGGPFGSAAYLGAAATLLIPVSIGLAADYDETRRWRRAALVAAVLMTVAAIGSQTRAAWVGLVVGTAVAYPAWRQWARTYWLPTVVGGVALILAVAITPLGSRLVDAMDFADGAGRGRVDEWRIGVAVVADRPVVGTGFEGYRIAFPEQVDAEYERRYTRQVTPDRAHNLFLDVAATSGLPGLLLFVGGVAWLVRRAWAAIRSGSPILAATGTAVVAYLAQQQFLFPIAELDPVFWVVAGLVVAGTSPSLTGYRLALPIRLIAAAIAAVALVAGTLDVAADRAVGDALAASVDADHDRALALADRAGRLRPDSFRYPLVASTVARASGTAEGLATALDRIDDALRLSPNDPILRERRAELLLDQARASGVESEFIEAAVAWQALSEFDPNNAEHHLRLGIALSAIGDLPGAEQAWITAQDLAPASAVPATNLALLYIEIGLYQEAENALAVATSIDPNNPLIPEISRRLDSARGES